MMIIPTRKSPRIPGFDYSSVNYYFVTFCTEEKRCIFGDPGVPNLLGRLVEREILSVSEHYPGVRIDAHIVMPNHVHLIVALEDVPGQGKRISLPTLVSLIKSYSTKAIRKQVPGLEVWQRSFHDHIIRNQTEYEKIWTYVQFNHQKWTEDCHFVPR